MIFVTVGTHDQGFERLVKKMDEIAGQIDEEVVLQIGHSKYKPENAEWFKFISPSKINRYYNEARIIVTHSGAGSLMDALITGNHIITVPRQKKFGEHIDDQQMELAGKLEETDHVMGVYDIELIESCLNYINCLSTKITDNNDLISYLKTEINNNIVNRKK